MTAALKIKLDQCAARGNFRSLSQRECKIDFASNDYLGLARSKTFSDAVVQQWKGRAMGSTGSRLLTGNSANVEQLESEIAAFHGFEAGLIFNCGYMANVGLLSAVACRGDAIFYDLQVHASVHDGIRLSKAAPLPFRHNDLEHLETRLKRYQGKGERFICVESIYSTDGSRAPLKELAFLAKHYGARLIVDEAHAVGVCGPKGKGLAAEENVTAQLFALVATFGKALGSQGAIVLGSDLLKRSLINFSRPCIYTTAPSPLLLAAVQCAYAFFPAMDHERAYLQELGGHIRAIEMGSAARAKELSQELAKEGIDLRALTFPTVKRGKECLRLCLHAYNTKEELTAMNKIIIAGIGTGVGKTTFSARIATELQADYWKPIECGEPSDTTIMRGLLDESKHCIHPPAYSFKAPLAPHLAAELEGIQIDPARIIPPSSERPLVIEMAGGVLVPLGTMLAVDLFSQWDAEWVVVAQHYLGCINHTLLTIEALKARGVSILGVLWLS